MAQRYKKVLLVNPPYRGSRVRVVFCAGLGYIAEALETAGIEYDLIDMSPGLSFADLATKIQSFQPDVLGISVMTYRYKDTYQLLATIKAHFPQLAIIVGGAHISLLREKVLQDCPAIDYGVVLEGEDSLVELCQGAPEEVKGIFVRQADGGIRFTGERPFQENLDSRPFPKYRKFDLAAAFNKELNALPIVSSRGCPFHCSYCPVQFAVGRCFRARSPQHILEEIRYWYQQGFRRFSFADDNFTLIRERVDQLCDAILASEMRDLLLSCDNGIRADRVDRELLAKMRRAGFYRIAFGVEAGTDKVLKRLHKNETIATITARIEEACSLGYEVDLFFLVGAPEETWEDLEASFRIALKYPIGVAYFYNIIPFPRTELFTWIEANGKFLANPDDYLNDYPILDNQPLFETVDMPYRIRKKALAKAFAITRQTMRRSWERRLSHLGVWAKVLAYVYTASFTQNVILRSRITRHLVYKLSHKIIS